MNRILRSLAPAVLLLSACGTPEKTVSDLPVRKACTLERLYQDMPQDIRKDTPDIAFVNALCAGASDDVVGLFRPVSTCASAQADQPRTNQINKTAFFISTAYPIQNERPRLPGSCR